MKLFLRLFIALNTISMYAQTTPPKPIDIDGAWAGVLAAGPMNLHLVFHIATTPAGLSATLDSLDQGAKGIPVSSVTRDKFNLKLEMKKLAAVMDGTISDDGTAISGTFTQAGNPLPLTLKRVKNEADLVRRRPQEPVKPYPYSEEEVAYDNKAAEIKLAATLTIPPGKGPFPAVLLITGSGPQDRDESLMGHRPFLVLADYLTRQGIVVLRADDRGTAKSTGDFSSATTADFATDAEAGLAFLKTRGEVDSQKIGLLGHSEGGIIAPMVAARNSNVAFIVMLAGTGVSGFDVLQTQVMLVAKSMGAGEEQVKKAGATQREILTVIQSGATESELRAKLIEAGTPEVRADSQIKQLNSPWMRYFLTYDPSVALRKVHCPVLALNGAKDVQVSAPQNLPAIRAALEAGGNKNVETAELPGLNHLFQSAKTGSPGEYGSIEETMSPLVLEKIAAWILRR